MMITQNNIIRLPDISRKYQKAFEAETKLSEQLKTSLNDSQRAMVDKIEELHAEMEAEMDLHGFTLGFKAGMQLSVETFKDTE